MPAFVGQADEKTTVLLVNYVFATLAETPSWGLDKIRASHRVLVVRMSAHRDHSFRLIVTACFGET